MANSILKTSTNETSRNVEALDLCWGDIEIYTFPVRCCSGLESKSSQCKKAQPCRCCIGNCALTSSCDDSFFVACLLLFVQNILGDNPACNGGAPLSIDWKHQNKEVVGVEYHEYMRLKSNPRRKRKQLQLSSAERDT